MEQTLNQPQTLCIKHLAKNYSKRWVVKDVSFSMQSGQIVGLLGPNGAGKPPASIWWLDWCVWTKVKFILMT